MSLLEASAVEQVDKSRQRHARFTLAGRGGALVIIERPITRETAITGVAGGNTNCPVVRLTVKLGAHEAEEEFALVQATSARPVLLGRTFLAGRVAIDSERSHITNSDDDWSS